jgi:hypothetical protein
MNTKIKSTRSDFYLAKLINNAWAYKDKQGEEMIALKQFLNTK